VPLQAVPTDMGPLGFYARSQSVEFGRDLGISDESEEKISANMAKHGFAFDSGPFELGEISFHLGWTFHKAGANVSKIPRAVMTVIYMDIDMRLKAPDNPRQANDTKSACPDTKVGDIIASHINPVLWQG